MKYLRLFSHLLGIICCALIGFILIIEDDPHLKNNLQSKLVHILSSALDCQFQTNVSQVNALTGTITLQNTFVREKNNNTWHWQADRIDIQISWLQSLLQKKMIAKIFINKISIQSSISNGQIAIIPHLKKYVSPSLTPFPFEVKKLVIHQGTAAIENQKNGSCNLAFRGHAIMTNFTQAPQAYVFCIALDDGNIATSNTTFMNAINGKLDGQFSLGKGRESYANIKGSCNLPQQPADDQICTIYGSLHPQQIQLHYTTDSQIIQGKCTIDYEQNTYRIQASASCGYLTRLAGMHTHQLDGIFSLIASGKPNALLTTLSIQASLDQCFYHTLALPSLQAQLTHHHDAMFHGTLQCRKENQLIAEGICTLDVQTKVGTISGKNSAPITFPEDWSLLGQALALQCTLNPAGELYGEYQATITNAKKMIDKTIKGIVHFTKDHLILQGTGEQCTYDFLAAAQPFWHLEYCDCDWQQEPVITLKAESPALFSGIIGSPILRLLAQAVGCSAPGQETLHIKGSVGKTVTIDISLKDGNIRLPYTYNLLQDIQATAVFDLTNRLFHINNLTLQLHKGNLQASRITGFFNKQHQLSYLHVPLLLNNCFLGMKKDLFALFSGALTGIYAPQKSTTVSGFVTLDRSHIRNNILSGEFRQNMLGTAATQFSRYHNDIDFNVRVMTRSPLRVKTSFLEAATHVHAQLTGSLTSPILTGAIEIINGSFLFPYKSLFIKRGKLYFLPHQTDDPVVDILAENNIRKYSVRMTVNGTVKNPNISFSSTPTLQEEQIIALLLGGSEDGSLFLAMPTSVMNSIQNLLFGPADTTSQFQRTLKNLFSPLKNLRITPSFSDQTARGGLRGSLIIDVNDRLRAIIEQNFSLTEDVVIQVEYDLSDDARIRATKDERGDLGGELEGRWKF